MATWEVNKGQPDSFEILLLTKPQFDTIPDGFELIDIMGVRAVKGKDYIDDDTRFGYLAYGIKMPLIDHPEAELLTKLKLIWTGNNDNTQN